MAPIIQDLFETVLLHLPMHQFPHLRHEGHPGNVAFGCHLEVGKAMKSYRWPQISHILLIATPTASIFF